MTDAAPDSQERKTLEDNLKSRHIWVRLVFMLLVVFVWAVSRIVIGAVVIAQFLWALLTGEPNARLTEFGQSLATYTYQIVMYLTFNTEERPFPFGDWPRGKPDAESS